MHWHENGGEGRKNERVRSVLLKQNRSVGPFIFFLLRPIDTCGLGHEKSMSAKDAVAAATALDQGLKGVQFGRYLPVH